MEPNAKAREGGGGNGEGEKGKKEAGGEKREVIGAGAKTASFVFSVIAFSPPPPVAGMRIGDE